jgi:hypothetical protein
VVEGKLRNDSVVSHDFPFPGLTSVGQLEELWNRVAAVARSVPRAFEATAATLRSRVGEISAVADQIVDVLPASTVWQGEFATATQQRAAVVAADLNLGLGATVGCCGDTVANYASHLAAAKHQALLALDLRARAQLRYRVSVATGSMIDLAQAKNGHCDANDTAVRAVRAIDEATAVLLFALSGSTASLLARDPISARDERARAMAEAAAWATAGVILPAVAAEVAATTGLMAAGRAAWLTRAALDPVFTVAESATVASVRYVGGQLASRVPWITGALARQLSQRLPVPDTGMRDVPLWEQKLIFGKGPTNPRRGWSPYSLEFRHNVGIAAWLREPEETLTDIAQAHSVSGYPKLSRAAVKRWALAVRQELEMEAELDPRSLTKAVKSSGMTDAIRGAIVTDIAENSLVSDAALSRRYGIDGGTIGDIRKRMREATPQISDTAQLQAKNKIVEEMLTMPERSYSEWARELPINEQTGKPYTADSLKRWEEKYFSQYPEKDMPVRTSHGGNRNIPSHIKQQVIERRLLTGDSRRVIAHDITAQGKMDGTGISVSGRSVSLWTTSVIREAQLLRKLPSARIQRTYLHDLILDVAHLDGLGKTPREIAEDINISPKAVENILYTYYAAGAE